MPFENRLAIFLYAICFLSSFTENSTVQVIPHEKQAESEILSTIEENIW